MEGCFENLGALGTTMARASFEKGLDIHSLRLYVGSKTHGEDSMSTSSVAFKNPSQTSLVIIGCGRAPSVTIIEEFDSGFLPLFRLFGGSVVVGWILHHG